MRTEQKKELLLRAGWEPNGWSVQESEQGEIEPYFGTMKAGAGDGREAVKEGSLTEEQGGRALVRLQEVINDLINTQQHYTSEWESEAAASYVYESLVNC